MGLAVVLQVGEVITHCLCSHAAVWRAATAHQHQLRFWNAARSGSDGSFSIHFHRYIHHHTSMLKCNWGSVAPTAWIKSLQYIG